MTARIESLPNEAAALVERTGDGFAEASGSAEIVLDAEWKNQCETLADECRAMLDPDSIHAPHLDAMAGARDRIGEAGSILETALLEMEIASFHGLAQAVKNWAGKTGGLEIDAPDYPELMRQAGTLVERSGAPAETKEAALGWLGRDADWKGARAEVGKFVELVGRIDGERKEHEAGCAEAGRFLPAPSRLCSGAKQAYRTAVRLESRMDAGERNAHIRAAGKDPDSLDSAVREIHNWLARDEVARKMENRGSHIGTEGDVEVQEWWDNQRAAHAGEINDEARTAIAPVVGQLDEAKRRDDTLEVARPKPPSWWKAFIFGTGRYERELAAWEAKRKALFFEVRALEKKYDDLVMLAKPGGLSMAMAEGALRKKHPELAERVADADKRERVQAQEEREKQWQIGRGQGHDHDIEV